MNSTRSKEYDAIAGLMVIVAILLHIGYASFSPNNFLHYFGFFMIWFFYKAGMFQKENPEFGKDFWINITKRLIIPFLVSGYFGFIVYALCNRITLEEFFSFLWRPIGVAMTGNAPSWFLITFVIVRVVFPFIVKFIKGKWLWCVVLAFFCLSLFLHYSGITNKVTIMNTSMSLLFCTLGFQMKLKQFKTELFVGSLIIYFSLCFGYPSEINLATTETQYGNYIVSIIYNAAGIILINNLFKRYPILQIKPLCHIGRYALTYFLFHMPILHVMNMIHRIYGYSMEMDKLFKLLAVVAILPIVDLMIHHPKLKMRWVVGES